MILYREKETTKQSIVPFHLYQFSPRMVRIIGPAPVPTGLFSTKDLFSENSLSTSGHTPPHRRRSDEDDNDDDSSVTTILSAYSEFSHDHDEDDYNRLSKKQDDLNANNGSRFSLASKLNRLQRAFDCRDRVLDRLSQTQNPQLMRVIRKREFVVRQQERELLLLEHALHVEEEEHYDPATPKCIPESTTADNKLKGHVPRTVGSSYSNKWSDEDGSDRGNEDNAESDIIIWYEAQQILEEEESSPSISASHQTIPLTTTTTTTTTTKPDSCFRRLYDMLLFEWHISAPAIMSLFFHTLAHASIYDVVEICVEEFKKRAELYFPATTTISSFYKEPMQNAFVFFVGISMMRLSGYLYWWLNDVDFKTIKFDLHNRVRLGFGDARYMLWVKRRPLFQALAFLFGYYLCYKVVFDAYEKFYFMFFQCEDDASEPPNSRNLGKEIGGQRIENMALDINFLWKVLDYQSFEEYWEAWAARLAGDDVDVDDDDEMSPLLTSPLAGAVFCTICSIISIMILRCYGFAFFDKY